MCLDYGSLMEICRLAYLNLVSCTYISGVFDLFFPLKNSGSALRSIACTLEEKTVQRYETQLFCCWAICLILSSHLL